MSVAGGWVTTAAGLVAVVVAGIRLDRLLRVYLKQRVAIHAECQRSERQALRVKNIERIVGDRRMAVRIVERDVDGDRMIEVSDPGESERRVA